jgi:hypothetical protein
VNDTRVRLGATLSASPIGDGLDDAAGNLEALRDAGVTEVWLDLDWMQLQPSPRGLDGQFAEGYERLIDRADDCGVAVIGRLHHHSEPRWFSGDGGFGDQSMATKWWPRWVELVAERFGDRLAGLAPLTDPVGWAARWSADPKRHSDTLWNLAIAWRDSWRILHGSTDVVADLHLLLPRAADDTPQAAQAARTEDLLRWQLWLRGWRDGRFVLPGRYDRVIHDLVGSVDVIGCSVATDRRGPFSDESLARWQERLGTIIRRAIEEGPDRPLSIVAQSRSSKPAEREPTAEFTTRALSEAVDDRLPIRSIVVDPGIDGFDDGRGGGLLGRDRRTLSTTELWAPFASG